MSESAFYDRLEELERLLAVPPDEAVVDRFVTLVRDKTLCAYAFEALSDCSWISPLDARGFFSYPPEPIAGPEGLAFPTWPALRLLIRVAGTCPDPVLAVLRRLPKTQNRLVQAGVLDTLVALPEPMASQLVDTVVTWLIAPNPEILVERTGKLIARLARGSEVEAALHLAEALLGFDMPDGQLDASEQHVRLLPETRPRCSDWYYGQVLCENYPELVAHDPEKAASLLCDLVCQALGLPEDRWHSPQADYSSWWRAAIETDDALPRTARDYLVSAIRDTSEKLIEDGRVEYLGMVESYGPSIFQRIGWYLRWKYPKADQENSIRKVTAPGLLDDEALRHEVYLFLRDHFGKLPDAAREAYLGNIERGPTQSLVEQRDRWQYVRLWPIHGYLTGGWRERFDTLSQRFGESSPEARPAEVVWEGPESPKTADELGRLSIPDAVAYLASWQPSGDAMGPSIEGLGRIVKEWVQANAESIAPSAMEFSGLDPTYVRAVVEGMQGSVKAGQQFDWEPVLQLCAWAVAQPREWRQEVRFAWERDDSFQWARKAIAWLLEAGLSSGKTPIPFTLRDSVWRILEPLTLDPDPTPEHEQTYGGPNMDPATVSINTVRGNAMHAVVLYALWVRRNVAVDESGKGNWPGFDAVPEVRCVLDHHLDPSQDPSISVRSVYGQYLSQLVYLDKEWVVNNIDRIFPSQSDLGLLRAAAWETYVVRNKAYDEVFSLLRAAYERAVDGIGQRLVTWRYIPSADAALGRHLMTMYWRGKVPLEDTDHMLPRFFAAADAVTRTDALRSVGMSLAQTGGAVPKRYLERIVDLWEWRYKALQNVPLAESAPELGAFGYWFTSGKLDDAWALDQMYSALCAGAEMDNDHKVIERLTELAQQYPSRVLECLRRMIENDRNGWKLLTWRDAVRRILNTGRSSEDMTARHLATDMVHRLGAMGHPEFRDLL